MRRFRTCCVTGCGNFRDMLRSEGSTRSYHRFPNRNDQHAVWVQFAARGNDWLPTLSSYICSDHFRPEDFQACDNGQSRLYTNAIPTLRPFKRILPETQTLSRRAIAKMQKVVQATVKYEEGPSQDGDFDTNDSLSPSPSISASEFDEDDMSIEEKEPAMEIQFTYLILRSGLALVTLPSEWNVFMDNEDFVMFFRIDTSSYEITHAVNVAADLVPKIRIHNLLYSGDEFGQNPMENFWCLKDLLSSLSCATICPGLESNFDGGCALVFKGRAVLCAACRARKRRKDLRARNNAANESEDDSKVRKYTRRKRRRADQASGMENFDLFGPNEEVCLSKDGILFEQNNAGPALEPPEKRRRSGKSTVNSIDNLFGNLENCLPIDPWFGLPPELPLPITTPPGETGNTSDVNMDSSDQNKEIIPLEAPKRRKRSAKTSGRLRKNLENSLPVDPLFGTPEGVSDLNTVPLEGSGNACDDVMDSSDLSAPVSIEDVGITSTTQLNESDYAVQENIKINKKTCHLCPFVAERGKINLAAHIRRVHPECAAQWTVECMYCGRKFLCEMSLKIHVKATHKDGLTTVVDPAAVEAGIEHMKTTGRFSYHCVACHRHYVSKAVFDLHQFYHSTSDSSHDQTRRDCPACDFHAPTFSDLVAHVSKHALRHKDKKPCLLCGKYVASLRPHVHDHHPDEMRTIEADWTEQCEECGEKYKWKRMLAFHKRSAHDGFQCLYCAKMYYKTQEFGKHVLEHRVDGVFPCPLCVRKYSVYPLVANHYHENHDITRFSYSADYRKAIPGSEKDNAAHMERCIQRSHSRRTDISMPHQPRIHPETEAIVKARYQGVPKGQRLPCDQCGKLFLSAASMSKHIRWVHFGDEKERVAKVREEKRKLGISIYKGYVKPRDRTVPPNFPYQCDECQLGYMKEINLIKHRETRHLEKYADSQLLTL